MNSESQEKPAASKQTQDREYPNNRWKGKLKNDNYLENNMKLDIFKSKQWLFL